MATPLIRLVAQAVAAGVTIGHSEHGALTLTGTALEGRALAKQLRTHDIAVLGLYDWRHAVVADPQPCLLCGRPAILRDPVDNRPAHKVCVDDLIRPASAKRPDTP